MAFYYFSTIFISAILFCLAEYYFSLYREDKAYNYKETVNSIYNGFILLVIQGLSAWFFLAVGEKVYTMMWGPIVQSTPLAWLGTFIVVDLLYYIFHRTHHRVEKLLPIHLIHHSGSKYNFSLALMLPWVDQFYIYLYFLPLVLVGFNPSTVLFSYLFLFSYQFCCHCAYIQFPRFFDYVLVTPRNHGAHHHQKIAHQDSNFGGVFSVWDRLCKTYTHVDNPQAYAFGIEGEPQTNFYAMQKESVLQLFRK